MTKYNVPDDYWEEDDQNEEDFVRHRFTKVRIIYKDVEDYRSVEYAFVAGEGRLMPTECSRWCGNFYRHMFDFREDQFEEKYRIPLEVAEEALKQIDGAEGLEDIQNWSKYGESPNNGGDKE